MTIGHKSSDLALFIRNLPKVFAVAGVYFLLAQLGLYLATLNSVASPVWPASGVALFFVLLWGPQMGLGVFFGAVAANYFTAAPLHAILGIGVGNTLEALVGVWIFNRISGASRHLGSHSRIVACVALSTIATTLSASIGTASILWGKVITPEMVRDTWLTWWVGDTLGALILFPLGIKICRRELIPVRFSLTKLLQLAFTVLLTVSLCTFVFVVHVGAPFLFIIFLSLLVATMWFSAAWIYLTSILICAFAILSTKQGLGPFYGGNLNENLLHLQLFLAGVGMTAIVLAALRQERSIKNPSLALVFGWLLTGMTFYSFFQSSVGNDQDHFNFQVEKAERELRDSLGDYVRLLETGSGLFAASENVTREEWNAFTSRLRFEAQYPGINGLGVIVPVKNKADETRLVHHERKNGFPDFTIHEVDSAPEEMKVKDSPTEMVVQYIEPMKANSQAVGLLISSEKHRLEGAIKSRDSGLPTITDQIILMQDSKARPSFVLYAPFYKHGMPIDSVEQRREAFQGLVFSPVVVEKFVETALHAYGKELNLKIFFGNDVKPERMVYSSLGWKDGEKYEKKSITNLAELPVTILWRQGKSFKTQSSIVASWAGFCGSLISIFLAIILSSLEQVTERAQKIAAERTHELLESEKELHVRQMALVASSRMSSLGQMASGMAHEINNPLAIISGKAQHLEFLLNQRPLNYAKAQSYIQSINSNVERIAKIIRGLRSIARDVPDDPFREVRAKDIMEDTLELCRSRFKHHDVVLMVPSDVSENILCLARHEQIVQVLLNLLNNAFDAVEDLDEKWVQVDIEKTGSKIKFSVADSGKGLSAELTDRIFDPFFTTKEVGKGTGLGLSISRGIIEKHSGRLYVDEHSLNTKFVVELESRGSHEKENTYC